VVIKLSYGLLTKKLSVFILFIFVCGYFSFSLFKPLLVFDCDSGLYTFYLYYSSSNAQMVTVDALNAKECVKGLQNVKGEGLCLDYQIHGKQNSLNIIYGEVESKKARLVFCEKGDWGECAYYYSDRIADFCIINGEKVNVHVVIGKNSASIGSPLLFGSF
jgi:hypothetical protein